MSTAAADPNPDPRVDDEWRRWIGENLLLGSSTDSILDAMAAKGIPADEARREISAAQQSPYLKSVVRLENRLKKRDWMLAMYRKLNRLHPSSNRVERRHKLSREAFLNEYYSANRPVIITGAMDDWPAMRKWNLDYFKGKLGDREVEVQLGRDQAQGNYEIDRDRFVRRMRFSDYIEKVRASGVTNDFYMTAANDSGNKRALAPLWDDVVQSPEYLDGSNPLNGFFWFGPAGTITPFHHDLTNNFMAQVIGRKRVKIAPSWDMPLMENHYHVFSTVDGRTRPATPDPSQEEAQILECILGPGEILFLPIGCLHFVEGLDVSVTVSFTNFVFDNDFHSFYTTYKDV